MESIFGKIKKKGIIGLVKSVKMRFKYAFVEPMYSMNSKLAKFIWRCFQLLPINEKLILFESEPDYCDNSWVLYQYLKENRSQYRLVWIVGDINNFVDKSDSRTSFVTRFGRGMHLRTIYYYATARWSFYTHWTFQPYIPRKGQTVVNLWHGGYPLKATKVKNRDYYDWLISMGEEGMNSLAKYIGCPTNKILPLGQPRIDLLVGNFGDGRNNPFCNLVEAKKVILWMPTFRASVNHSLSERLCDTDTGLPLLARQEDLIRFNSHLQQLNVVVIAKIHHLQAQKKLFKTKYSNFVILTDDVLAERGIQLYEILGKSDALITDYSTVVWDYLVADKPIGFILDDIDSYNASCGFNVDNVKNLLKGEHIYNEQQLIQFLQNVINGKDDYRSERNKQLESKIQMFPHGGNCKNIVDHFGI